METRKGRSVPVMKEFQVESSWVPPTPVKPSLPPRPQLSPIYNDGYGGGGLMSQGWVDQEDNLSRYTQQNHSHAQTLLSYSINSSENNNIIPTTSNNIWDVNHGASSSGRIQIQRDNTDVQRRGLEDCLLHWSSQGRRSQLPYGSSNIGPNSYSNSAAWETSQPWTKNVLSENDNFTGRNSTNPLDNLDATAMSFKDLIGFGGSLTLQTNSGVTGNGGCYPGWVSQPEGSLLHSNTILGERDYLHGVTQQSIGIHGQGLQNGAVRPQYQYVNTFNSPSSTKHANRSSTFAPETPDSWQRMASDAALGSTNPVTNIGSDEQKLLHEHDVVAALIDLQDNHNEKAPGIATETSPDENSVVVEEDHNPDKGGNQVLDLNQTPQKKARRRRYQPKVIRESKPKSTPKPKTPKTTETQIKRKYMRKDKTNTPAMMPAGEATEASEPKSTKQPARSCKKSLNFDLNGQVAEEDTVHMTNDGPEAEPAANVCQIDKSRQPVHVHVSKGEDLMINTSILSTAYDLNLSVNQELRDYISLPTKEHPASSQTDINDLLRKKEKHSVSWSRIDADLLFSPCASSNEGEQNRGSKRRLSYTTDPIYVEAEPAAVSHSIPWQLRNISPRSTQTEILPQSFIPEICKKKRTEKVQRSSAANTSPASEIVSQEAKAHSHSTSKYYCNPVPFGLSLMANHQGKVFTGKPESMEQLQKTWADLSRLKKKKRSKGATRVRDLAQLTGIASAAKGALLKKTAITTEPNSCTGTLMSIHTRTEVQSAERSVKPRSKRRPMKQDSVNKSWDLVIYNNYPSTKRTTGSAPAASRRKSSSVEEITRRMERLDLKEKVRRTRRQEQRALVPYRARRQEQTALVPYGQEDSIVPFDGPFNPIRKRRQRAKVELDDETTRVWRLLLENIDNEGINGTDEDKAKWWENERRVFRGRVDSFIARMRLVQGDRRFTPWKGSVLDSVIGVFLTQNVSDHLSSSAFMSMAARFPLKPESPGSTLSEEATSILVEEPDICELEHEESITWNVKTMDQPTLDRNSRVLHDSDQSEEKEVVDSKEPFGKSGSVSPTEESSEICQRAPSYSKADNANRQTAETEINYILGDDKARDDATSSQQSAISSQNSINSPNLHTAGIMNTFSESNSRIEAMATSSQFNYGDYTTSFMGLLKMVEPPPNEAYGQTYLQIPTGDMKHTTEYFTEAPGVSSSIYGLNLEAGFYLQDTKGNEMLEVESKSDDLSRKDENSPATEQSNVTSELTDPEKNSDSILGATHNMCSFYVLEGENMVRQSKGQTVNEPVDTVASSAHAETTANCKGIHVPQSSHETACVGECTTEVERTEKNPSKVEQTPTDNYASGVISDMINPNPSKTGRGKPAKGKKNEFDWDSLRRDAEVNGHNRGNTAKTQDSLDWEAVRHADVREIADTIKERGMNNMLAERIKDLLDRLVRDHGSINMEWLRDIPPDKAKEYLLSFRGLGLKSVECVRLLTLHHLAFPVDTNVGRIAVRLGWVPLQPLPESLQLHLLELYPVLESIQKYLWPRLCKLDQKTLYELHYHMITFGKVFCTKRQPNCNACPLRGECRHFASAFASARFALPGPEERSIIPSVRSNTPYTNTQASIKLLPSTSSCGNHNPHIGSQQNNASAIQASSFPFSLPFPQNVHLERKSINSICEPIVEVPASPEPEAQQEQELGDIEDTFYDDPNEIPTIQLNMKEFTQTLQNFMHSSRELQEAEVSKALVALTAEAASLPTPKLKNISRLRTEHHVYELPDTHPLLHGMNRREPDDPCSYLLAIWTPGETADSIDPPARKCSFEDPSMLCNEETCSYCSSHHEANTQTVRGTLLIPCRTAMRGSFPLNGTYFQVNEVFADHDSSLNPIAVPRTWLWNLPRRTVYFGTSIPTLFRGMTTEDIQHCFWRGYVCVRGFDQKSRAPRPLMARLHFPASKMVRGAKGKAYDE